MKLVKEEEREFRSTETAKLWEFPHGDGDIDCCVAEINGRHPTKGWFRNTACKEMIYCKSGLGKLQFESGGGYNNKETGKCIILKENDAVLIDKGEWYFWTDETNGVFVPVCSPRWTLEQGEYKD